MKRMLPVVAICAAASVGCSQSTTFVVKHRSQPNPQILRGGGSAVRVAIQKIDANWDVRENHGNTFLPYGPYSWTWTYQDSTGRHHQGSYRFSATSDSYRSREAELWAGKLKNAIAYLLRKHGGSSVSIIERDRIDLMRNERNMQLANMVESTGDPERIRWSGVDAYIVGDIHGLTTVEQEIKSDSGWAIAAGVVPFVGGAMAAELRRPKPHFRRTMTVSGNLRLVNAANGRTVAVHEISSQHFEDKKSYPFKDASRLSMVPEEKLIRKLLDDEVRRFCGQLVPVEFEEKYLVKSSSNEDSQLGVKYLRANDPDAALQAFCRATVADPGDHRSHFGAGVASEKLGRLREATEHYRAAVMNQDESSIDSDDFEAQYERALRRVEQRA